MFTRRKLLSCAAAASLTAGPMIAKGADIGSNDAQLVALNTEHEALRCTINALPLTAITDIEADREANALCNRQYVIARQAERITPDSAIGVICKLAMAVPPDEAEAQYETDALYDRLEADALFDARRILFGERRARS